MMTRRTMVLAQLLPTLLPIGCQSTSVDAERSRSIVGRWVDSTSQNMAARSFAYDFKTNGELEVLWGRDHPSVRKFVDADPALQPAETGTWRIQRGWLRYEIKHCNMADHPHRPYRYRLIEVSGQRLVFETAQGRETYFRADAP